MCIQVVERYSICRCIYYRHAVDPCLYYGKRGHRTVVKEVSVGYQCSKHSLPQDSKGNYPEGRSTGTSQVEKTITDETDDDAASSNTTAGVPEINIKRHIGEGFPEVSTSEYEADMPLRMRLLHKRQENSHVAEYFIASSDLDELLTEHAIGEELQRCKVEVPSSSVFPQATKVFAILLVIRRLDLIVDLVKSRVGDEHLPLQIFNVTTSKGNALHLASSKWDNATKEEFYNFQWAVLAPKFVEKEHLCLDDNAILPFTESRTIARGGYGGVHKVKIHNAHENLGGPSKKGVNLVFSRNPISTESAQANIYAVKQFVKQDAASSSQQAFDHELSVLKFIKHDHIVTLLGSYQYRNKYSMIFPLAEEDLRHFWEHTNPSSISKEWYIQQMTHIANALSYLHTGVVTKDFQRMQCWHMDIKPTNILIMRDASTDTRSWKITDFGSSYIYPGDLGKDLPSHAGSGTYEAPECQLDLPPSRAWDIWSFGCIVAECLVWLLRGSAAIDTFAEDRLKDEETSSNIIKDDCFFSLKYDTSLAPIGAMVRPAVLRWLHDLERDPLCDQTTHRLLRLIRDHLLRTTKVERMTAGALSSKLEWICKEGAIPVMEQGKNWQLKSNARITGIKD